MNNVLTLQMLKGAAAADLENMFASTVSNFCATQTHLLEQEISFSRQAS